MGVDIHVPQRRESGELTPVKWADGNKEGSQASILPKVTWKILAL